jgi:hypothetical protein
MADSSPWLTSHEAVELLEREYNVRLNYRTIENKCSSRELESQLIAGQRRIHEDKLRAWALKDHDKEDES